MLRSNISLHRILGALNKDKTIIVIICTMPLAILSLNEYYWSLLAKNLVAMKREAPYFHKILEQIHYIQRSSIDTGPNYSYLCVLGA